MKWCRNCIHWQSHGWRGNCARHHWERELYGQDADARDCQDYFDKARPLSIMKVETQEAICQTTQQY